MPLPELTHVDPDSVRDTWTDRAGRYSPAYYTHYGPDERSRLVRERIETRLGTDASVLELGCGSGRHLHHLADHGFDDLTGIDIDAGAFDAMRETYPDLAASGTFHCAPIEERIDGFERGQFDAVYSVETLQHLHPDAEWVFAAIARITDAVLITAEIEGPVGESSAPDPDVNFVDEDTPLYYRDWGQIFTSLGLEEVDVVRGDRETTRTFRVAD